MATFKKVLLWIAAIIVGLYESACLISLFGESGSDFLLSAAIAAVLLFFIIRALRKPPKEKPSADKVQPSACPRQEPEDATVSATPVIEERTEPQPQIIIREVYIKEQEPELEPESPTKKSWLDDLPEYERRRKRIEENKKNGVACCPRCGSTSLSVNKKGYSFVKGFLLTPLGGTIGMNKLKVTCLNCGHKFKPGR